LAYYYVARNGPLGSQLSFCGSGSEWRFIKACIFFMERIKRGSGRVNIAKMAATDVTAML
jgi:hypothetical protein